MISFKWFSLHWGTDHIDTIYKKTLRPPNTKNTEALYKVFAKLFIIQKKASEINYETKL